MPYLSPPTLTKTEQDALLSATSGRDHLNFDSRVHGPNKLILSGSVVESDSTIMFTTERFLYQSFRDGRFEPVVASGRERAFDLAEEILSEGAFRFYPLGSTQVVFGHIRKGLETLREHARTILASGAEQALNSANAQLQVSMVLTFMGDLDGAIEAAEAALAIAPEHFPSYSGLAFAMHQAGKRSDVDEALDLWSVPRSRGVAIEKKERAGQIWVCSPES